LQKGQLGHGDLAQRNTPTAVKALEGKFVVGGSCGRNHTAVVLRSGETYTWGSNLVVGCPSLATTAHGVLWSLHQEVVI
jgi:alpha-tubulin suppressor-like RCC1 family protein